MSTMKDFLLPDLGDGLRDRDEGEVDRGLVGDAGRDDCLGCGVFTAGGYGGRARDEGGGAAREDGSGDGFTVERERDGADTVGIFDDVRDCYCVRQCYLH